MRTLTHLRDFMTEEELKFLPGRLQVGNFMLLEQHFSDKVEKDGKTHISNFRTVIQVFTASGTWIGCIEKPDFIPSNK